MKILSMTATFGRLNQAVLTPGPGDELAERTPEERLEQFLYDGDDRNIAARYCGGAPVGRPFPE